MIHEAMPDKLILGTEIYQFFKGHPEQMQNFTNENPSLVPFAADYVIGGMIWTGMRQRKKFLFLLSLVEKRGNNLFLMPCK